jgi:hypothetical protein
MPQIYDMGLTALLPHRRKACWGLFSAGFEPANLDTKVQHATPRPSKPFFESYIIELLSLESEISGTEREIAYGRLLFWYARLPTAVVFICGLRSLRSHWQLSEFSQAQFLYNEIRKYDFVILFAFLFLTWKCFFGGKLVQGRTESYRTSWRHTVGRRYRAPLRHNHVTLPWRDR